MLEEDDESSCYLLVQRLALWLLRDLICRYTGVLLESVSSRRRAQLAVAPSLNRASQNTQARNHFEEVSVAKAVGSIVFAFTICWIPSFTSSGEIILWDLFEKKTFRWE